MNIGLIGNGNLALYLLQMINVENKIEGQIISILGRNESRRKKIENTYNINFFTNFDEFIHSSIDLVIEVATVDTAKQYTKDILKNNKDIIVGSVGALKESDFVQEITRIALDNNKYIYLPSGAIGGLDLLQAANSLGGLRKVSITTVKSPLSLGKENTNKEEVLFEGSAAEAIDKFPKNVNVALILSLAGIGVESTKTFVKVNPDIDNNIHIINAEGSFGEMEIKIKNNPMPNNPKTSYLAALSIISTLKNIHNNIKIG